MSATDVKPDAWMPLYTGDWDGDTGHLDCEEDGAYGRLVRHYWRNGPLPDDDAKLARIIRMELRRWKKIRPTIAAFFRVSTGVWNHKRVDAELIEWAARKEKAINRAKAAAEARWGSDKPGKPPRKQSKKDATSIHQAVLDECPSSSSTVERASNKALSHSEADGREARHGGTSPPRPEVDDGRPKLTLVEPRAPLLSEMTRDERRAVVAEIMGRGPKKAQP